MLTSRDLFRMAKHLGKMPGDVIQEYCQCYVGRDSRIPIVRLLPRGVNNACPFLLGKRCQIHAAKPVVCALYPVGRALMLKETPEAGELPVYEAGYILQPTECGSLKKTNTVRQWLEMFGIPANDEFYSAWNAAIMRFSTTMRAWEEKVSESLLLPLQNMLVELIYVRYDTEKEFIPQFLSNVAQANTMLDELSVISKTAPADGGDDHGQ